MFTWQLAQDGSFSLICGPIALRGCYPAVDGMSLRPLSVAVSDGQIRYALPDGELTLRFSASASAARIETTCTLKKMLPWRISPLNGTVDGATKLYRLGLGFSGPSGWTNLSPADGLFSHESYLATALSADQQTLAMGALDHRDYLQKTIISNRQSRRGLTNRHVECAEVSLDFTFLTENVPTTGETRLPTILFTADESSFSALQRLAKEIAAAMRCRTHQPARYHWCSWYERGCNFTLQDLNETLSGLHSMSDPPKFQSIQIDDGYCDSSGDWLTPGARWPGGLSSAFTAIRNAGYTPGIWVAPFMVGSLSRLYRDHPDWIIRNLDGSPVVEWKKYDASGIPSHIDPEHYALDASHPGVQDYIREVFRTMRTWEARFYKTDFMDWGLRDTRQVRRHNRNETSVQSFRRILQIIREEIGEDSYWLACISPYGPFLGFADGMRIANDVGPHWGDGSQGNMIAESMATQFFNQVFWQNDPDVILLRRYHNDLSDTQTRTLAMFQSFLGSSVNFSDRADKLPPERLALMRFARPPEQVAAADVPVWDRGGKLQVLCRKIGEDHAILVINPTRESVTEAHSLRGLIGVDEAYLFDWGPSGSAPEGRQRTLLVRLAPHDARLVYASVSGAAPGRDLTITGRRVTPAGF